jgi:choline dehydrogenase-like flavoprotein
LLLAGSFQPGFNNTNQITYSNIAATQQTSLGTLLYEDDSEGIPAILSLAAWERSFVPSSLRNSPFATTVTHLIDFCRKNVVDPPIEALGPSPLCNQVVPIVNAGCDKRVFGIAVLLSEATSRGSVTRDSSGRLQVDVNYMATAHDIEAFGAAARVGFGIMTSFTGPAAPQTPCADKNDAACKSMSCPDLIADYIDYTKKTLGKINPAAAEKIRAAPASVIYPQFLEPALADNTADNTTIGELLKEEIFAAHHLAGTAAIGTVVDGNFQVIGVEGLFVADASVLPRTSRGNTMATVMAIGRIAGVRAVQELA